MCRPSPSCSPSCCFSILIFFFFLLIAVLCVSAEEGKGVKEACKATQYPQLCDATLGEAKLRAGAAPNEIISAALQQSLEATKKSYGDCSELLRTSNNSNFTTYVGSCLELLLLSQRYLQLSKAAPLPEKVKDVEAWMSAALTWHADCNSSLKYVTPSKMVTTTMEGLIRLINMTSNALSMVQAFDYYGAVMSVWKPPVTERSNASAISVSSSCKSVYHSWNPTDYGGGKEAEADAVVSKDNSSFTIQDAVNKAPDNSVERFVIYVKAGVYEEIVRIPPSKNNITLIGDGMDRTVITGSLKVPSLPGNVTTYSSATFAVNADGFIAKNITFENKAGSPTKQAVALRVDGDLAAFYDCSMLGHQDTLYAHTLRQYYKNCRIEGTVDFIFGNAAAVFEDCVILVRPRQENVTKASNTVTAHGRTDPAQTTGFVFRNCTVNGTQQYVEVFNAQRGAFQAYLGRPWKIYSRTVFMNSFLGKIIDAEGWMPWAGDFALDTLYYGEFRNSGPGADLSRRVNWSSVVPEANIQLYSRQCFIQSSA